MRTVSVTTTRTTAAGTELTDNAILTDRWDIYLAIATMIADCIVTDTVIMRVLNAAVRTTVIVHAFGIVRPLKRLTLALTLPDFMTSTSGDVFTI